jgi:hypothetical protein
MTWISCPFEFQFEVREVARSFSYPDVTCFTLPAIDYISMV